jgi:hypothetical protein
VGQSLEQACSPRDSLQVADSTCHTYRPAFAANGRLVNLGSCLSSRFSLTSDMADLYRAIEVTQQAVDLTLEGNSDRPGWLENLGALLSSRYSLTSDKADLDKAIRIT